MKKFLAAVLLMMMFASPAFATARNHKVHKRHPHYSHNAHPHKVHYHQHHN